MDDLEERLVRCSGEHSDMELSEEGQEQGAVDSVAGSVGDRVV
jgi:hypothetical protein